MEGDRPDRAHDSPAHRYSHATQTNDVTINRRKATGPPTEDDPEGWLYYSKIIKENHELVDLIETCNRLAKLSLETPINKKLRK